MTSANDTTSSKHRASVWNYKPWWCQPWSIVLTGVAIVAGSGLLFHRLWVTGLVALPVAAWWVLFLGLYPKAIAEAGVLSDYPQTAAADADASDN